MAYIRENPPPGVFLTLGYSIRHAATAYSFPYIKVDPTDAVLPTHVNARKF